MLDTFLVVLFVSASLTHAKSLTAHTDDLKLCSCMRLAYGCSGQCIQLLSSLLNHPDGSDEFTESLQQTLIEYQKQNDLMVTGVTDEATWIALFGETLTPCPEQYIDYCGKPLPFTLEPVTEVPMSTSNAVDTSATEEPVTSTAQEASTLTETLPTTNVESTSATAQGTTENDGASGEGNSTDSSTQQPPETTASNENSTSTTESNSGEVTIGESTSNGVTDTTTTAKKVPWCIDDIPEGCPLVRFEHENLTRPIAISPDFAKAMRFILRIANMCSVKVIVSRAFFYPRGTLEERDSANVGHAIEFFIELPGGNYCGGACLVHGGTRGDCFTAKMRQYADRIGACWKPEVPYRIEDNITADKEIFDELLETVKENCNECW